MRDSPHYGVCPDCAYPLEPVWFIEEEYETFPGGGQCRTGRVRRAVDYLICEVCLKKQCVDDSFDGPWY